MNCYWIDSRALLITRKNLLLIFFIFIYLSLMGNAVAQGKLVEFEQGLISMKPKNAPWPPKIPIEKCKYHRPSGEGEAHFDCDDYSYAYKLWWEKNYPKQSKNVYQVSITYRANTDDIKGSQGHVMNFIKVSSGNSIHSKFCLIEPQGNLVVGCWLQDNRDKNPKVPRFILKEIETIFKGVDFQVQEVWNENLFSMDYKIKKIRKKYKSTKVQKIIDEFSYKEKKFTSYPDSVEMFEECTQLDINSMQPLSEDDKNYIDEYGKILKEVK